jgi:diacylglycerol kinase (ATP)
MHTRPHMKLLFIVNAAAGKNNTDWAKIIREYFENKPYTIVIHHLSNPFTREQIQEQVTAHQPDRVIAVGGDGTVKLVTESIVNSHLPVGILPAGSANGMAKELGIAVDPETALGIITHGIVKNIDLIRINQELCIHLSDIGFNAFVVKTFETFNKRGMWSYIKSALRVLWRHRYMEVTIAGKNQTITRRAAMVVIANATKYGTGAVINPNGKLDDGLFEIIVIRKIAFGEIFKMMITHKEFDTSKTELFTASRVQMASKHRVYFQVDGEYLGKIYSLEAECLPGALQVIVPADI